MPPADADAFLEIFLQESADHFEALNQELVRLEDNPADRDLLYSILRHVHTLKGSAGMFGFERLKTVGHRLEDLMELVHAEPQLVDRRIMDLLFAGCDIMEGLLSEIGRGGRAAPEFTPRETAFLASLDELLKADPAATPAGETDADLQELLVKLGKLLPLFAGLAEAEEVQTLVERLTPRLHGRPLASPAAPAEPAELIYLGEREISGLVVPLRAHLARARTEPLGDAAAIEFFQYLEVLLDAAAALELPSLAETIGEARESLAVFRSLDLDFDALQAEYFSTLLGDLLTPARHETPARAEEPAGDDGQRREAGPARKTVRIEEAKIDTFLNSVGELIILGEIFNHLEKRLTASAGGQLELMREFKTANTAFAKQIFALQEALMDVRRIEIRNVTGSLNRLVRDTARDLGKEVLLKVEGEEAVVDKSLLDDVKTCLVHLVRNALDHGLETPAERAAAGKGPAGEVAISAANEEGFLLLKVADDGKGLDLERLRRRAVELGLHSPESAAALDERSAARLVFADGLSTAERVSDVSGRGVGMGAVAEIVRRLGGSVDVASSAGSGTEIILRLPLSIMLAVLDGLVVEVAGLGLVIPVRHVVESFRLTPADLLTVQGRGECVNLRGEIFRLLRLGDFFGLGRTERTAAVGILVAGETERLCLLVDEILDHQQVVIKTIEGLGRLPGILGGSLLGDGTVGLVLDIEGLLDERPDHPLPGRKKIAPRPQIHSAASAANADIKG